MKHLRTFNESFYDVKSKLLNDYKHDIQDVLQDLIDEGWIVDISYTPKRWENPKANYHISSDYISVDIRKNKCKSGSIYPPNSDFKPSHISDYTLRLVDMYKGHDIKVELCLAMELDEYDKIISSERNNPLLSSESDVDVNSKRGRMITRRDEREKHKLMLSLSRYTEGSYGRWCDANIDYLSNDFYDVNGLRMRISLDGENIDQLG